MSKFGMNNNGPICGLKHDIYCSLHQQKEVSTINFALMDFGMAVISRCRVLMKVINWTPLILWDFDGCESNSILSEIKFSVVTSNKHVTNDPDWSSMSNLFIIHLLVILSKLKNSYPKGAGTSMPTNPRRQVVWPCCETCQCEITTTFRLSEIKKKQIIVTYFQNVISWHQVEGFSTNDQWNDWQFSDGAVNKQNLTSPEFNIIYFSKMFDWRSR